MDMDMNMDSGGGSTDYSDYTYQFIEAQAGRFEGRSGGFLIETEPLQGQGGLDNNEVAELVYMEVQADVEFEDEKANITQATATEIRGCIGANLGQPGGVRNFLADQIQGNDSTAFVGTDDRVFQLFQARGIGPSDDNAVVDAEQTVQSAGGDVSGGQTYEKAFRQLTGRGPVLDSSDNLDISGAMNSGDPVPETIRGTVRVHVVWDVAEVSDAGRAFSVPN